MLTPVELGLGIRYFRAERQNRFISFSALITIGAVALGVWALITVMSVMNGLHGHMQNSIVGAVTHVKVSSYRQDIKDWRARQAEINSTEGVTASAPYMGGQGMLNIGQDVAAAVIHGVDYGAESKVSDALNHIDAGDASLLQPGEWNIVIGASMAKRYRIEIGDKVTLIIPEADVTVAGVTPRLRRFTVVATYQSGWQPFDVGMVYVDIDDLARLYRHRVSAPRSFVDTIRVKTVNLNSAPEIRQNLNDKLPTGYYARDWTQEYAGFFAALTTEKRVMAIVLSIILLVAAFNIVSTLVMLVTEKHGDIAILRTQGLSPNRVMGVFLVLGGLIGLVGIAIGTVLGVLTALNFSEILGFLERLFHTKFFPADVYGFAELNAELRWSEVGIIIIATIITILVAALFPARQAAKLNPSEALRYE